MISRASQRVKERAKELPYDYFVVLVGDITAEETFPTYQKMLGTLHEVEMRPMHASLHGQFGQRHGRLKRISMVTFKFL